MNAILATHTEVEIGKILEQLIDVQCRIERMRDAGPNVDKVVATACKRIDDLADMLMLAVVRDNARLRVLDVEA